MDGQDFPMSDLTQPLSLSLADLAEGREALYRYRISAAVHAAFMAAFDDRSPVHVDDEFARARGFEGRVSHGAILNGFLSHFVGMRFPGASALLLSAEIRYQSPCFLDDEIELRGRVSQRSESAGTVLLGVVFYNVTRQRVAASGKVFVRVGG